MRSGFDLDVVRCPRRPARRDRQPLLGKQPPHLQIAVLVGEVSEAGLVLGEWLIASVGS